MRILSLLVIITALVLSGFTGCTNRSDDSDTPRVYSDADLLIHVSKNEHFYITLVSDKRDQGYRWGAYFDGNILSLIGTKVQKDIDNQARAGDIEWFEFKASEGGNCDIRFVYVEYFSEGMIKPIDEKVFTVNIR